MELICKIQVSPRYNCSDEGYKQFWGSVIIGSEDEESPGQPKKAHVFVRSPVDDEEGEIIQWYASVESLNIKFQNEDKVLLYSNDSLYNICISHVSPVQMKTFVNYLKKLLRRGSSKLKLPPVSHVSKSMFQLPISLINVNVYNEYLMKVELKEDLENVISLNIQNCSLTTPIGSGKMKNLRLLWLENNVLCSSDVLEVESSELKELHVYRCELQFEIRSLFQNKLNCVDSLSELCLERNQLSQLPDGVFQFRNLIKLSLNDNHLTQLPDQFFKLTKLKVLWVANNQLQYLPSSLLSLQLKDLDISQNSFVHDIKELVSSSEANVHSLKELTYRTILNNKLVMRNEEKLPKSLREILANHHQCLCGSKFIGEGRAVTFLFNFRQISIRISNNIYDDTKYFPLRGVVCRSLVSCGFRRFRY